MSVSYGGSSITFEDGSIVSSGSQGFKNKIINGAMMIDQRNAGAALTSSSGYGVDRFYFSKFATDELAWSIQQDTSAPAGFINSQKVTITTAETSLTTNENVTLGQVIEGLNIADLNWGTANAKTVTLSFWVRSSLTGTFGGALFNSAANRFYPFSYTILAANTWEYETITITGDTSGTWLTTNGAGIYVQWGLGQGPDRLGTAGAWTASNNQGVTGQVQLASNLNATWQITGVQLEKGTTASSFEFRTYTKELMLCQRYYAKISGGGFSNFAAFAVGFCSNSTTIEGIINYPVTMRAAATLSFSNVRTNTATGTNTAVTSVSNSYAGTNSMNAVFVSSGSSITQGQAGSIIGNSNSSAYVDLSAEL